jgi:hypothetical protein
MNVKLIIDDVEVPVGYDLFETIVDRIGNHEDLQDLYHKIAESDNQDVLYALAYYDNLREDTIEVLLEKGEMRVVERILNDSTLIAKVEEEQIIASMKKYPDTDIFKAIASNFGDINAENPNDILNTILEEAKDNFAVIGAIADGYDTPKHILKKLSKHSDVDVARKAKERLE